MTYIANSCVAACRQCGASCARHGTKERKWVLFTSVGLFRTIFCFWLVDKSLISPKRARSRLSIVRKLFDKPPTSPSILATLLPAVPTFSNPRYSFSVVFLACFLKGVHGVKDKMTLQFLTRTQTNPQVCVRICRVLMRRGGPYSLCFVRSYKPLRHRHTPIQGQVSTSVVDRDLLSV